MSEDRLSTFLRPIGFTLKSAVFDPIVDEDTFKKVQEKIAKNKNPLQAKPTDNAMNWLKDFLVCGQCNMPMVFHQQDGNSTKQRRDGKPPRKQFSYRCRAYSWFGGTHNPHKCKVNNIRLDVLEPIIDRYLEETKCKLLFDKYVIDSSVKPNVPVAWKEMSFTQPDPTRVQSIKDRIAELEDASKRVWHKAKFLDDELALTEAKTEMHANTDMITVLKMELKELEKVLTPEEMVRKIAHFEKMSAESNHRAKREALKGIIDKVLLFFDSPPDSQKYHLAAVMIFPVTYDRRLFNMDEKMMIYNCATNKVCALNWPSTKPLTTDEQLEILHEAFMRGLRSMTKAKG